MLYLVDRIEEQMRCSPEVPQFVRGLSFSVEFEVLDFLFPIASLGLHSLVGLGRVCLEEEWLPLPIF